MSDVPTASIPSSWIWSRIQDVATTATGGTPSRSISEYFGGSIPWVKSGELGDGHVFETEETLSELGLRSSNAKLFPKGTLCIALYGATVGKLGILEVDAATNQAVCGIFLPDEVNRDFVFHYLASIRRYLIEQGKGGAQSNISNGLVRQTWIPIAPLTEQHRIVAKIEELFSDLDAGVAALKRAKANLKRYRAAVLKAAVEGKLTEEWRAKHPAKESASALLARILKERRQKWEADQLAKFAAAGKEPPKNWRDKYIAPSPPDTSALPELPDGWCWTTLGFLKEFSMYGPRFSSDSYSDEGVLVLRTTDFSDDGCIDFETPPRLPLSESDIRTYKLEVGDLLITRTGSLGTLAIFNGGPTSIAAAFLIYYRLGLSLEIIRYLFNYLKSPKGQQQLIGRGAGVGRPNLNIPAIDSIPISFPPLEEQIQINLELAERFSQIDATESQIEHGLLRAARLRQSILKQAFEGKLVPQDPKDEPASVLLERLRASRTLDGAKGKAATETRTRKISAKSK